MNQESTSPTISELTGCFRWFAGLLALHVVTFFIPAIWLGCGGRSMIVQWGIGASALGNCWGVMVGIKRYVAITGARRMWGYLPFAMLPGIALGGLMIFCLRIERNLSQRGYRVTEADFIPRGRAGVIFVRVKRLLFLLAGVVGGFGWLYSQITKDLDHATLQREGQRSLGKLVKVTHKYTNLIPAGQTFQVEYAGRIKTFSVSAELLRAHTKDTYLGGTVGGTFVVHEIPVIYLPERPDVAELPEMLRFSFFALLNYVGAIGLISLSGRALHLYMHAWLATADPARNS